MSHKNLKQIEITHNSVNKKKNQPLKPCCFKYNNLLVEGLLSKICQVQTWQEHGHEYTFQQNDEPNQKQHQWQSLYLDMNRKVQMHKLKNGSKCSTSVLEITVTLGALHSPQQNTYNVLSPLINPLISLLTTNCSSKTCMFFSVCANGHQNMQR